MTDVAKDILDEFKNQLDTRIIVTKKNAYDDAVDILSPLLGSDKWLVCVDPNTKSVAGDALISEFEKHNQSYDVVEVPFHASHEKFPMCDDERVAWFEGEIKTHGASAGVAVGSGTINDIVKLACSRHNLPMACIGTAPSMNGFTSGIAAVLSDGVKTTQACKAPIAVISDIDVMAQAPARMIQSGLGDLISKPVSNSDWALSAHLNGTVHSADAMRIIETGAALLDGVAPKLPSRDRDAVAGLVDSLMLSGLAMSVAGSSAPASGGEHLISHFIDMTAHAFDEPYDFHGCQVGVGTLTTAHIYERVKALDPSTIDVDAIVANHAPWESHRALLEERFGPLFGAVAKHAEPAYPTPEVLRARLTKVIDDWDIIWTKVSQTLRTRQSIEDELSASGAPTRYSDLNVEKARARRAIVHSKDIRNRYTILHLAWELGHLETWADEALELLY